MTMLKVREGDTINIDITGPGATLALGMMFFDSGNEAIAEWMDAPRTQFLLEFVRPGKDRASSPIFSLFTKDS